MGPRSGNFGRSPYSLRHVSALIVAVCALMLVFQPSLTATPAARLVSQPRAALADGQNDLSRGTLSFEPNRGQAPAGVRFITHTGPLRWFFSPGAITLAVRSTARNGAGLIQLSPVRPSTQMRLIAASRLPGIVSYLVGSNPRTWRAGLPTYASVRYRSVYPGIDLTFQGRGASMEYAWMIAPDADPARIALAVTGARRIQIAADGGVTLTPASGGALQQLPPRIYQRIAGRRRLITGHYILRHHTQLALAIGAYDHTRPLIVDPTLQYMTKLSGSLDDWVNAVTVDSAGNAYVTGGTQSDDFPTQGPLQGSFGGDTDSFVTKLDPTGKVLFSTYLGGSRADQGYGIAVNAAGDVFVAGATESTNFPTTAGTLQSHAGGGTCPSGGQSFACDDAFIAKLDPTGSHLLYSTYLGGTQGDWARGIALDAQGDAVVVGATYSSNFPAVHALRSNLKAKTCGAYDEIYKCPDAFVAKLNPTGAGLLFSTYLGGTDYDIATAVALGPNGAITITGQTNSADFPVFHGMKRVQRTPCKIFQAPAGRCPRAFVATLDGGGSALTFSSYLGGSNRDWGNGIALDRAGNLYVVGQTSSTDFPMVHPVQPAHYKGTCHDTVGSAKYPCPDSFITKINPKTGKIVYSSHIGGTAYDGAAGVAVDARGNAYVDGWVGSYNFPVLHALQKRTGGGEDAFVLKLTPAGSKAYFSTYLGGENDDEANSIALGPTGDLYVAGETDSPRFPKSVKYGPVPRGIDAFVVRIHAGSLKAARLPCDLLFGDPKTGCLKK